MGISQTMATIALVIAGAGFAALGSARGAEPNPPDLLCRDLVDADAEVCRELCIARPADDWCSLSRRFGGAVVRGLKAQPELTRANVDAVGKRAGLDEPERRRLVAYLEAADIVSLGRVPETALAESQRLALAAANSAAAEAVERRRLGQYSDACDLASRALDETTRILGADDPSTTAIQSSLGVLLHEMGKFREARGHLEHVLRVRERLLGREHPHVASSLSNLGLLLKDMGELSDARQNLERALEIRTAVLGPVHPLTAASRGNLGALLQSIGELARALEHYEGALAIDKITLGLEHPDTATDFSNLGSIHAAMGNFTSARSNLERALAIGRRSLDSQHPNTATVEANLGTLLQAMGDLKGAREHIESACAIFKSALGDGHPRTMKCRSNLGALLLAKGDLLGAKVHLETALETQRTTLGRDHLDTAESENGLGLLLQAQGDLEAALPHLERALEIETKVLGAEHPNSARARGNLGVLRLARGEFTDARSDLLRALEIDQKALGLEHPDTALVLNNLGVLEEMMGNHEAAWPKLKRALHVRKTALGEDHPDTATSLSSVANLLWAMGDKTTAREYLKQAADIRTMALGPEHPETAAIQDRLGRVLHAMGEYQGARSSLVRALEVRKNTRGPEHPDTAESHSHLGLLLQAMGEYSDAQPHLEQAYKVDKTALGPEHPVTASRLIDLGVLLYAMRDYSGAVDRLVRASSLRRVWLTMQAEGARSNVELAIARQMIEPSLGLALSAALAAGRPREAFQEALRWQGLATSAERLMLDLDRLTQDAAIAPDVRAFRAARSESIRLSSEFEGDTAREADRRRKRIEVDARLARLESGLKKVSVDFARRRQRSEIDLVTLCNALRNGPAGGDVLLDFVRFDRPTVPAQGSVTWTARYGAFVVRPSASACSVEHADLGPADGVDALVGAWRESVSGVESCWVNASGAGPEKSAIQCKREMERMDMMGAELRGRTLDPVRHLLPTDSERRIWLVQDGRLAEVPFGALPWSETKEGYTTYLAERWSFGYVSAPADLAITPPRSANEQAGALVVGDVNYEVAVAGAPTLGVWRRGKKVADASDGERLAASAKAPPARTMGSRALCGYTTEWGPLDTGADAMAASLSMKLSGDVQTLSGDGAVEARVVDLMGRSHSVLHIGTHGFSSMPDACDAVLTPPGDRVARLGGSSPPVPDAFALGGLALSGANRSVRAPERPPAAADGILSARELLGVDLRGTGLAVLSACETGRGSPTAGEGVLGLAKALLMAGTRTAVVSLWQVDVSATNALFERYYALGLSGGRVVPDQAGVLTRVQRQMADRYRRGEFPIRHSSWLWGAFLTLQAEGR